ncbi:MAG: hypothetical protein K5760_07095 [Clostridium sp.]|nr:hypothetical protein [Clostridium sp.]
MTSALMQTLLKSLGALGFLLLIGTLLRAKVPAFRKMLIPASVLGGFIGLFLGPELLGSHAILPFPEEWRTTWSLMPSTLIVPIFAAIPLGNFKKKKEKKAASEGIHHASRIAMVTGVHASQMGSQIAIGVAAAVLLGKIFPDMGLYENFGFEMSQGFNGGHGTAGAVGNVLLEAGVERWELVQGVATTFATIGLLGGILMGIFHINRAQAKGRTVLLKQASSLPDSTSSGIQKDITKQVSVGRETTSNSNIECLSVHIGLIFLASAAAYLIRGAAVSNNIPGFKEIPVWPYALIVMHFINFLLQKFHLEWLIDSKVKSHLSGMLSDFAIVAAIASMPVKAVAAYIVPMVLVSLVGFVLVYFMTIRAFRFLLPDSCPFERGIYVWGMGTGVMMTGMALLKICDPDYELPVLEDYSVANIVISMTDLVALPIMYNILCYGTSQQMIVYGLVYTAFFIVMALVGKVIYMHSSDEDSKNSRIASSEVVAD